MTPRPSLAKLQYAITQWAAGQDATIEGQFFDAPATPVSDGPDIPLTVILLDHGGIDQFLITRTVSGNTVSPVALSSADLDAWLDLIQGSHPCRVQVMYDACFSGTFLDNLGSGAADRIIITSASGVSPAFFTVNGTVSFSQFFFNNLMAGQDLKSSFNLAAAAIGCSLQTKPPN